MQRGGVFWVLLLCASVKQFEVFQTEWNIDLDKRVYSTIALDIFRVIPHFTFFEDVLGDTEIFRAHSIPI